MNITYLIGNGFDVNLGLKSRYVDFYNAYVKIHPDDEPDVIKRFKSGINDYIKKETNKDNLSTIDWRDLEVALGQFTDKMTAEEAETLYIDINDRLKEYLKNEYRYFDAGAFNSNDFLSHLTNPVTAHFNRVTANELKNYFSSFSNEESYNIINFNYTSTIEKLAGFKGKRLPIGSSLIGRQAFLDSVHHIHHTLNDEEILVGVNDVSQIANKAFHDNNFLCNLYVKPKTNELLGTGVNQDCETIIANTNLFVLFGTSAGITDQHWWHLVCERLIGSNARLIYFVHCTERKPHMRLYFEDMKNEEIKKLFEHAGLDLSVVFNAVINRCYVSFSNSMFKLPVTYNDRIKHEKTYKVGNSEVTMKVLEMGLKHIAVSVEANDEETGIPAEGLWLKENFPNYTHNSQHLLTSKVDDKEVPFDFFPISNKENRKDVYFEISSFLGKNNNKYLLKSFKTEMRIKALNDLINRN